MQKSKFLFQEVKLAPTEIFKVLFPSFWFSLMTLCFQCNSLGQLEGRAGSQRFVYLSASREKLRDSSTGHMRTSAECRQNRILLSDLVTCENFPKGSRVASPK